MKLGKLLKLANDNVENGGEFSVTVGQAQMAMYKEIKSYGYNDEDDLDSILDKHPNIELNNFIIKSY